MKIKNKLVASSSSLESIKKMIGEYFYSNEIALKQIDKNSWNISNGLKSLNSFIVKKAKGRYRFERKGE